MPEQTTNYNLIKPLLNETADIAVINQNMDILDAELNRIDNNASDCLQVGADNKSVQEVKALFLETDTRTVEVSRSSGQISLLTIKDPEDHSTVATVTVSRENGQISMLDRVAGSKTVTLSVDRSGGQITSISKVVN